MNTEFDDDYFSEMEDATSVLSFDDRALAWGSTFLVACFGVAVAHKLAERFLVVLLILLAAASLQAQWAQPTPCPPSDSSWNTPPRVSAHSSDCQLRDCLT